MHRPTLTIAAAIMACAASAPAPAQSPSVPVVQAPAESRAARIQRLFAAGDRGETALLIQALAEERDPDVRALLRARLAATRLDPGAMADPRLGQLAAEGTAAELRLPALALIAGVAFADGDYARAAGIGATLERLQREAGDTQGAETSAMAQRLAAVLAAEPRQQVEGRVAAGSAAARRDPAGLMRVDIRINGSGQEAVFDTGANLSVLSASAARRLGVRLLDIESRVGNGVRTTVAVRLGIADRLEIAGTTLRHVPFLIIDDSQLSFPGGYTIEAILGFPAMRALERFRVEAAGRLVVEPATGEQASEASGHNLHSWGNELFVDAEVGGVRVPLHLDSGANASHLDPLFVERNPAPFRDLPREQRRLASAGGTASGEAVRWRNVAVEIGGRSFTAPSVLVGMPGGTARPSRYYGVVGADLLTMFGSYTIDLRAMRLELGAPMAR